jgi:hypothetical protein
MTPKNYSQMMSYLTRPAMARGGRIGYKNGPPGKSAFRKPFAPEIEKRIIELANNNKLGAEAVAKKLTEEFGINFSRSPIGKRITALKAQGLIKEIPVKEKAASIAMRGDLYDQPAGEKYLKIREIRDVDRKTIDKSTGKSLFNIPEKAKFKINFGNTGARFADVTNIPEEFIGVKYFETKEAAEKALAKRKKLKLIGDVDPDPIRRSANKKKYDLIKEVSNNNIEDVLAKFKKGEPLEKAHRLSLNQVKKTGEMYNVMNLGLDFDDPSYVQINNKLVKPYENKLKQLYAEQNKLYKKAKNLKSIPLELRKQIEFNNKKISAVVDLSGGRVQGLQLDEFNLKPKTYGVNYANVFGFGLYDKSVKQLTKQDRETIGAIMQYQVDNEKKTAGKTAKKLFENKNLLNKVDELAVTGLSRLKPPSGSGAVTLGALDAASMFKKLSPATRKLVSGAGGFILPEVLFYQLDKQNRMSKGQSEKEAAAGALESGTLGAYDNKAYMEGLKETAESIGIDSQSFDSAYQLNLLSKSYNQNNAKYEKNYMQLLEMGDEQRADDLKKNFDRYTKETQNNYKLLTNNIADNVMNTVGASPLIMKEGRENITQKQFEKPFYDMQDTALEKLKQEKIKASPIQKRQVDTTAGNIGEGFYQAFDSLTQGAKNLLQGRVVPFASKIGFPQYEPQASQRKILSDTLQNLSNRDLERFNLGRGYVQSDPVSSLDIQNLIYEQPGVFFAGGGIAKLAGVDQGPPPESGPNPQGLLSLKNRVRNY